MKYVQTMKPLMKFFNYLYYCNIIKIRLGFGNTANIANWLLKSYFYEHGQGQFYNMLTLFWDLICWSSLGAFTSICVVAMGH